MTVASAARQDLAQEIAVFDGLSAAGRHGGLSAREYAQFFRQIELAELDRQSRIIDLGCGDGLMACALARLGFISRAKRLGCSLEEITDLVELWDGERCAPVQRRFHELVTAKIADAEHQIAELTRLRGQLEDAAALLAGPATDGPCGPACACLQVAGEPA